MCIFFIPRLTSCDDGEIFDGTPCIPGDVRMCSLASTSTDSTSIETTTPIINLEEICAGVFFGARPHPHSSTLFIGCVRGSGKIMSCINGEFFDSNLLECVPQETCDIPDDICKGISLDIIKNPCDCEKYLVCYLDEISVIGDCEDGYIFDVQNRQ